VSHPYQWAEDASLPSAGWEEGWGGREGGRGSQRTEVGGRGEVQGSMGLREGWLLSVEGEREGEEGGS